MEPLISVIVPVYGTEAYLPRCIESLLAQTYSNLEIILVDDGSPDSCGQICDQYAARDSRIRVIHQENAGVSAARNRGIGTAEGEYIGFVDSDDFVMEDMYAHMYHLFEQYQADIVQCARRNAYDNSTVSLPETEETVELLDRNQAMKELMCSRKVRSSACDKLYKRTLFENNRFNSTLCTGEDFIINSCLISKARNIAVSSKVGYIYYYRKGSASKGGVNEKQFLIFDTLEELQRQEKNRELVPYWKLRKAMFAMNFLRRMIPAGDFSRFVDFREYMKDVKFILLEPKKYRVSNDRHFAWHILLVWLAPKVYIRLLKGAKK